MHRILVANRGEPVIRAVKTFRRLGIATAVAYAPEDAGADWLAEVDYAYPLTSGTSVSPYLDGDQIIQVARANHCDAVWPAWGFLAENAEFAQAVIEAGLTWIGPPPGAMRALGSKEVSSQVARKANVPTVPEEIVQPGTAVRTKIDYPLLLKPALGGGGQGQAIVRAPGELNEAWEAVCRINAKQFQNGPVLVQKYIEAARHIEVQVLADEHGTVVAFHERECSIQRRNQKIIEESPSPALSDEQRVQLLSYARALASAAGYASAGTLEFLFSEGEFYFLEMNTRLQVEHPITEETTRWVDGAGRWRRIDLLEEMLRVARGDSLRFDQDSVRCIGHAVEARIYAEDPSREFAPSPGLITSVRFPIGDRFRVETAIRGAGAVVDPRYDPMIAKLITWGETRDTALSQLRLGLERTIVGGVTTNVSFLHAIVSENDFLAGNYSTNYVGSHPDVARLSHGGLAITVAALALYERDRAAVLSRIISGQVTNVAAVMGAVPPNGKEYSCSLAGREASVKVFEWSPDRYVVACDSATLSLTSVRSSADEIVVLLPGGEICAAGLAWHHDTVSVTLDGDTYKIGWSTFGALKKQDPHAAPGGGRIVRIAVEAGQNVSTGDLLYVTEAMKMEARVVAAFDGTVTRVEGKAGCAVDAGATVLTVDRDNKDDVTDSGKRTWSAKELFWPEDPSAANCLFADLPVNDTGTALEVVRRYFQGYDISLDVVGRASSVIERDLDDFSVSPGSIADTLASLCSTYRSVLGIFSEGHAHATVYFVEHIGEKERRIPKGTEDLLTSLARSAGFSDLRDCRQLRCSVLHWLQAARYHHTVLTDVLIGLIDKWAKKRGCRSDALSLAFKSLVNDGIAMSTPSERAKWRDCFRDLDWDAYYAVELPPVAREYWDIYEQCLADPLNGIPPETVAQMRAAVGSNEGMGFLSLDNEARTWLEKWFATFDVRGLPITRSARTAGVNLFLARERGDGVGVTRLIAVADVSHVSPQISNGEVVSLPEVERAAIESYWMMRAFESLGVVGTANHVFLFLPKKFAARSLTPSTTRAIAARITGFARHLHIVATEAIMTLGSERQLVQVWHAREVGVLSRPPIKLAERVPESALSVEKAADLRQQRLGKLLNRDRARLLFDDGKFEELLFPEVDAPLLCKEGLGEVEPLPHPASPYKGEERPVDPIGLNIYRGRINGADALAYAGDFRFRGGALGEREGKKLAASVVLAYALQVPLIGIHDGAGANIKGSVASLGWAGAYFGAIAATGGFSSHEKFCWWLANHHERAYFEKVLRHFSAPLLCKEGQGEVDRSLYPTPTLPLQRGGGVTLSLIHLHLHLGAAVGMLVYGPSISSCAIMVDHPEVYRLLTGAATVERVTGEKGTNYSLGGAQVHSRASGEIDIVYSSEEAAISGTRNILSLLQDRNKVPSPGPVKRSASRPQPTIPESAGIIAGRDAILANVDDDVFFETRDELSQAGGLITGYARLNGQPVMLAVTATDYGMHHGRAFKKMQLAAAAAHDFGLPLIVAVGANWDRLHPVVRTESIYQQHEMRRAIRDATVPKIGIALGPRSLERSIHEMMDMVWYVQRGGETPYELQRAHLLSFGVTDNLAQAFDWCADILRYLPRPAGHKLPADDPVDRPVSELQKIIPQNLSQPYDMREVLKTVFDSGSVREFSPGDHQPLHVGLATLGGHVVGFIADAPNIEGGAQTVVSISKFTRFHRLCARFSLPVIEFNDSPAFRPGKEQEHSGIQGEGGKSIREEVLSTIPKIAVTLRQNYGGRYIHANLVTLGPPRRGLVVEGSRLGVMGAEGAVGVLFAKELSAIKDAAAREKRKQELVAEYEATRLNPSQAIVLGYAEAVIPLAQLRSSLHKLCHVG